MAPSQLKIATHSLRRLVNEEASYHREQESQEKRIKKLEQGADGDEDDEDGNREFKLKQERKALEETKALFPGFRESITSTREKLESLLDTATDPGEVEEAKKVLKAAKEAQLDDPIAGQV